MFRSFASNLDSIVKKFNSKQIDDLQAKKDFYEAFVKKINNKSNTLKKKKEYIKVYLKKWRETYGESDTINLSRCNLSECTLSGLNLSFCDLRGVDFTGSNMFCSDLTGAIFDNKTIFENAVLSGVMFGKKTEIIPNYISYINFSVVKDRDLGGANFDGLNLTNIDFSGLNLAGASFRNAMLTNVDFTRANLNNARFTMAKIKGGKFEDVELNRVNFQEARIEDVELKGLNLQGSIFGASNGMKPAELVNVNLRDSFLADTNFVGCRLKKVNLSDAILLSRADFRGADLVNCATERVELFGISEVKPSLPSLPSQSFLTLSETSIEKITDLQPIQHSKSVGSLDKPSYVMAEKIRKNSKLSSSLESSESSENSFSSIRF